MLGLRNICFLWLCLAHALSIRAGEADTARFPARVLREYALTSASARERYPDPRNWLLLASNDGGQTWTQLDIQSNQVFRARSQRRVYRVANRTAYNAYRLVIEGASSVQLAELELIGPVTGVANGEELHIIASSSKAHALMGTAINAFDEDPATRWIDFGAGTNVCWLQCQYTFQASNCVTNVAQFAVASRHLAAHNPLFEKAPQVLANFTNPASRTVRVLSGYALTSANDSPARDPRDWRLLGSNDRGATWQILDARRNETFAQRFQRRVFSLTNEAPYFLYRLQIDCVRVPADQPGGASCVQLAEIEPIYSKTDPGGKCSILASAEGENPPMEAVEHAFDGKARTKWLSFTDDNNTNRSSWVQWEYLPGGEPRVLNLRWVKALQAKKPIPIQLSLEGAVVSWNPTSKLLGFLDETGFQQFAIRSAESLVQVGDRVRLTGTLEPAPEVPAVLGAELVRVAPAAEPEKLELGQALPSNKNLFQALIEARVTSVAEDSAHWTTLGLAGEDGVERMI